MTTDKLIAELKLVSWVDRKPGMGSMDAVYLDDAIQIIRNYQPEPTQKQVDNAELEKVRDIAEKIAKLGNGEYYGNSHGNTLGIEIITILDKLLGKTTKGEQK